MVAAVELYLLQRTDHGVISWEDYLFPAAGAPFELTITASSLNENFHFISQKIMTFF